MASLRYAEGLGLDIPEANTATEIHLEIIYKMFFCSYLYMFIYIFVGWRVLGLLGVHPRLVGRFNKNAPVTLHLLICSIPGTLPISQLGNLYVAFHKWGYCTPAGWLV